MAEYTSGPFPRPIFFVSEDVYKANIRLYTDLIRRPSVLHILSATGEVIGKVDCGMDLPDPVIGELAGSPEFETALADYYAAQIEAAAAADKLFATARILEAVVLRDNA